jgi:hypothetical protein
MTRRPKKLQKSKMDQQRPARAYARGGERNIAKFQNERREDPKTASWRRAAQNAMNATM